MGSIDDVIRSPTRPKPPSLWKLKAKVEELVLPPISPQSGEMGGSPRSQKTKSNWNIVMKEVKKTLETTREAREKHRAKIIGGYIGAMKGNAHMAAVQEEALVALCQIVNTGQHAAIKALVTAGGLDAIILAMRTHVDNPDLLQRATSALGQVSALDDTCCKSVIEVGGISVLTGQMDRHIAIPSMSERVCATLAIIASCNDHARQACIDAGVVPITALVMRRHLNRASVQANACKLLAELGSGRVPTKLAVTRQGGIAALVIALEAHREAIAVQGQGCIAIERLSAGDNECIEVLVSSGCVRCIENAIRRWPTEPTFAQLCVSALANITNGNQDALNEIGSSRCLAALNHVVDQHILKTAIVERAMATFCNLLANGEPLAGKVLRSGALQAIKSAAGVHVNHESVLDQACRAICNAAMGNVEAKAFIIRHAGLRDVVLLTIREHGLKSHDLAEVACAALANLAAGVENPDSRRDHNSLRAGAGTSAQKPEVLDPSLALQYSIANRQAILDESSVNTILSVISAHIQQLPVIEECLAFLRNLAAGNASCRDAIIEADGLAAILKSMRTHRTSESLVDLGCQALRNLAGGSPEQIASVVQAGAIQALLAALATHKDSNVVAQAVCSALRNMAVDSWVEDEKSLTRGQQPEPARAVSAILEAGGVVTLVRAMRAHQMSAEVQSQACGALRNLACGTPGDDETRRLALAAIMAADGIAAIIDISLKGHLSSPMVQAQGCAAIRNLAQGYDGAKATLEKRGAIKAILEAMRAHPSNAEVQTHGCACITNFATSGKPRTDATDAASQEKQGAVDDVSASLVAGGAYALLAAALARFPNDAIIVSEACGAICSVASTLTSRARQLESAHALHSVEGAVQALADAVCHHGDQPAVLTRASSSLAHLAIALPEGDAMPIKDRPKLKNALVKARTSGVLLDVPDNAFKALLQRMHEH